MALWGEGAKSFKALSSSSTSEFLLPLGTCHQGPGVTREGWSLLPYLGEVLLLSEKRASGMGAGQAAAEGQSQGASRTWRCFAETTRAALLGNGSEHRP